MSFAQEIMTEVTDVVLRDTVREKLNFDGRKRVEEALWSWLSFTARKKALPDLPQRLEAFRKRIGVLADTFSLELEPEGFVVRTTGDAESTLRQLERGTDWFDPASNVTTMIVGAVFE